MEARNRGRGYGRARGGQPQQQRPGGPPQGQRQQPPQDQAPRGPPQGSWVRPAQPQGAWPRPQMGAPQQPHQPSTGRGARAEAAETGAIPRRTVTGDGDQGNEGRGAASNVRGRAARTSILVTKPSTLSTKKGNAGVPITLLSNYLPLIQKGKWCLYQYRVDMSPDIDNTGKRKGLLRRATQQIIPGGYLFDGTVLYTPYRLNPDPIEVFAKDDEEENIRITIRLVGDVVWGDAHYLQLFNIIVRKCLALMGLQLVGRNYFMPDLAVVFAEYRIQLWPGFATSMRQHEKDILLNVDLSFKFMRTDNVYDLMLECRGGNAKQEFQSKIIGSVVLTYYNNKTYTIDDIDFNSSPESKFKKADGSEISFRQYFQEKYKVAIRERDQPMLVSRSKQREIRAGMPETVYLVPELCRLTGLSDAHRNNFNLMKQLANHTRIGPEGRIKKLNDFGKRITNLPECVQEFKRWELGIAENLVRFQGRVLPPETMVGGGDGRYSAGNQADWTRELRSKPMFYAPKMDRLAVVCPTFLRRDTEGFVGTLVKCAQGMRWSLGQPRIFDIPDDRSGTYIEHIEKLINTSQPTLIMVVLKTNSADRYSAIKKKCYVDRGVPTQMIVARNLTSKGVMSIATKVAIQMNCKIGGAPWSVMVPLQNMIVVGYDVCRDTVNKKKSFAGMVASLDRQMTRYFSYVSEHKMEEELSGNFATFLVMAAKKYQEVNGCYPERWLIYRDGVGDGQIPYVHGQEVDIIKKKLKNEIYKGGDLKLAFIIVSKRINTRIFTEKDNPPPGTVVDDVITLPERYDFFLVSQCVRQGTVSPTSYNVIEDTMGLPADKMQILTHKMTHMYYNWSGTVRVPAPCQYAHKLAFMVSQNLHRAAHPDLENVLYYL